VALMMVWYELIAKRRNDPAKRLHAGSLCSSWLHADVVRIDPWSPYSTLKAPPSAAFQN
jgi:hypothetical protein